MFEVFDDNVILDMLKLLPPTYRPLLSSQKGVGWLVSIRLFPNCLFLGKYSARRISKISRFLILNFTIKDFEVHTIYIRGLTICPSILTRAGHHSMEKLLRKSTPRSSNLRGYFFSTIFPLGNGSAIKI